MNYFKDFLFSQKIIFILYQNKGSTFLNGLVERDNHNSIMQNLFYLYLMRLQIDSLHRTKNSNRGCNHLDNRNLHSNHQQA